MRSSRQRTLPLDSQSRWRWLTVPGATLLYVPLFLQLYRLAGTVAFGSGLFLATLVAALAGAGPGIATALCLQSLNLVLRGVVGSTDPHPYASAALSFVASTVLVLAVDRFRTLVRRVTHLNRQLDGEVRARAAVEARLKRGIELQRNLVATLGEGVGLFDAADRFLFANEAAGLLLGVSPDKLIGRDLAAFLTPESKTVLQRWNTPDHAGPAGFELQLALPTERVLLVTQTRMQTTSLEDPRYLRVMRDITERTQLERDRRALDQHLQRTEALHRLAVLAGGVAHDLNNLLSGVIGNVDLALLRLVKAPASAQNCLEDARKFAVETVKLSRKMLANVSEPAIALEATNLAVEVAASLRLVEGPTLARAAIKNEIPEGLPLILAERIGLHQVVTNLVVNAIDAMKSREGATLTLSAWLEDVTESQGKPEYGIRVPSPGRTLR